MTPTNRVKQLRKHALAGIDDVGLDRPLIDLLAARGWINSAGQPWMVMRRAVQQTAILEQIPAVIDAGELLVGKTSYHPLAEKEQAELARYQERIEPAFLKPGGMNSHMAIDFDKLLTLGVVGIRTEIEAYRETLDTTDP